MPVICSTCLRWPSAASSRQARPSSRPQSDAPASFESTRYSSTIAGNSTKRCLSTSSSRKWYTFFESFFEVFLQELLLLPDQPADWRRTPSPAARTRCPRAQLFEFIAILHELFLLPAHRRLPWRISVQAVSLAWQITNLVLVEFLDEIRTSALRSQTCPCS